MMKNNGYNPSILDTEQGIDYILKVEVGDTARHEIYYGGKNRLVSQTQGFWVNVCPQIHAELHTAGELDKELKKECQRKFEETHTRDEFMYMIGRSYL